MFNTVPNAVFGSSSLIRIVTSAVIVAALVILLMVVSGGAAPEVAHAKKKVNACKEWGNKIPGDVKRSRTQKAILCFVNRERQAKGLGRVKQADALQRAAQRYSRHMQKTKCFSHTCPGVPQMVQRLRNAGYPGASTSLKFAAENLAWGSYQLGTPRNIIRAWMNSAGHRANILSKNAKEVGVGVLPGTVSSPGVDGGVYTTNFGKRG